MSLNPILSLNADGSIKMTWTPDPNSSGYVFLKDGALVSTGLNPAQSSTNFAAPQAGTTPEYGIAPIGLVEKKKWVPAPPAPAKLTIDKGKLTWTATAGATGYKLAAIPPTGATQYRDLGNVLEFTPAARPGETWQYDIEPLGVANPKWYGRVTYAWPGTDPTPPPIPPPPSGDQLIGLELGGWGGSTFTECKSSGIGYYRTNEGGLSLVPQAKAAGMKLMTVCVGEGGTIGGINPAQFGSLARSYVDQYGITRFEVLNEPEGSWFWSDAGNAVAHVNIIKAVKAALAGTGCLVLASFQNHENYGDKMIAAGALNYVDECVLHTYGGSTKNQASADGARQSVIDLWNKSGGHKIAITECGWPTAVGQPATGDSAQWTEAEQQANVASFCQWVRANPQMISIFSYFQVSDYGTNNWYGLRKSSGAHKPSWATFAGYAND